MKQRERLSGEAVAKFRDGHPGWDVSDGSLVKTFAFASYAAGIAFVVRLGFKAEASDHHPDLEVGYRKVRVAWVTHDVGGITSLDTELARTTDELAG
jgi:4a-hydroxytetrahydrobiopterin dehydratase